MTGIGPSTTLARAPAPLLAIRDLSAGYGPSPVIRSFSISLHRGEIVGIAGANGTGKSTLLQAIAGGGVRASGTAVLDGRDLLSLPADARARARLAYLPQTSNVFRTLTIRENLRIACRSHRRESVALERLDSIARPLMDQLDRPADVLSGGDRQSLALAMCFAHPAQVFLLDEPLAGLSSERAAATATAIASWIAAMDAAALIVEHRLAVTMPLCQRVIESAEWC